MSNLDVLKQACMGQSLSVSGVVRSGMLAVYVEAVANLLPFESASDIGWSGERFMQAAPFSLGLKLVSRMSMLHVQILQGLPGGMLKSRSSISIRSPKDFARPFASATTLPRRGPMGMVMLSSCVEEKKELGAKSGILRPKRYESVTHRDGGVVQLLRVCF